MLILDLQSKYKKTNNMLLNYLGCKTALAIKELPRLFQEKQVLQHVDTS